MLLFEYAVRIERFRPSGFKILSREREYYGSIHSYAVSTSDAYGAHKDGRGALGATTLGPINFYFFYERDLYLARCHYIHLCSI